MTRNSWILWSAPLVALASPAAAKTITVTVDAASGPWSVEANKKLMPYGKGDERPSVVVPLDLGGGRIAIYADGTTDIPDKKGVPPAGVEGKAVDDTLFKKARYPSFYTPKILYPAQLHALVVAFVDEKGVLVGRPIVVGEGIRVPLPENTAGLSLGFNDAVFTGNTGALKVTIELPD